LLTAPEADSFEMISISGNPSRSPKSTLLGSDEETPEKKKGLVVANQASHSTSNSGISIFRAILFRST
jgi:hypothetical protein